VVEMVDEAAVEAGHAGKDEPAAPPVVAPPEPASKQTVEHDRPAPDPWEKEFDDLADGLIDQLRRDLGPAGGPRRSA